MTTFTSAQVVDRVLRDLGLISAEEVASAEDYAFVLQTIQSEIAGMTSRGVPIINGAEGAVPLEYLTALSRRLGLAVGPGYGVFSLADTIQAIPVAEELLSELGLKRPQPLVATFDGLSSSGRRGTYDGS